MKRLDRFRNPYHRSPAPHEKGHTYAYYETRKRPSSHLPTRKASKAMIFQTTENRVHYPKELSQTCAIKKWPIAAQEGTSPTEQIFKRHRPAPLKYKFESC